MKEALDSRIQIRRARPEEAELLTRIARAAKGYWSYPDRWMVLWQGILTITPEFISINQVYSATMNGSIVGFYGMIVSGSEAILDHLWVNPDQIGTGIGRELFSHAVNLARSMDAATIEIESDPNAEEFYKRMGATRIGVSRSQVDGMERLLPLLRFEIK
jgi:GNAT superfamily N-acetyltransferase